MTLVRQLIKQDRQFGRNFIHAWNFLVPSNTLDRVIFILTHQLLHSVFSGAALAFSAITVLILWQVGDVTGEISLKLIGVFGTAFAWYAIWNSFYDENGMFTVTGIMSTVVTISGTFQAIHAGIPNDLIIPVVVFSTMPFWIGLAIPFLIIREVGKWIMHTIYKAFEPTPEEIKAKKERREARKVIYASMPHDQR